MSMDEHDEDTLSRPAGSRRPPADPAADPAETERERAAARPAGDAPSEAAAGYVDVALPVPLPEPMAYGVPAGWLAIAVPGVRVRVGLGKRRLIGVVVAHRPEAPQGVAVRLLEAVLDRAPVLSRDLLDLARFTAGYYMAPLGEVLRTMLPADLEPWGDRRVWLTDRGALALPRAGDAAERAVIEALREGGRMSVSELQMHLGLPALDVTLAAMEEAGRIASDENRPRSARYVPAVELAMPLAAGERLPAVAGGRTAAAAAPAPPAERAGAARAAASDDDTAADDAGAALPNAAASAAGGATARLAAAIGRSAHGRAVVEFLADAGRPATIAEVTAAVGCGAGVLKRLAARGVLRQFTQVERLSLDRHRLAPRLPPRLPPPGPGDATGWAAAVLPPAAATAEGAFHLRADQAAAVARLVAAIQERRFEPLLLQGITGSGKTEVYLRAAMAALAEGRSAILLVPEIALVPALAREALERFGERLAILHSGLGTGERNQEWERVRSGGAMVVLGPRSALFAPVADLGLIVVDEEQDPAYKQELSPRYHARDLALVRCRGAGAAALLVSATPSLESRHNVERSKLGLLRLTARVGQGALPTGILVDLRLEEGVRRRPGDVYFSARLRQEITACLAAGEQAILLRNRRGYAPMLLCRACGESSRCPDCGLPRTYHRRARRLICHYCGQGVNAPAVCPTCSEEALEPIGAGTERVEEDFAEIFPGVPVDVLDRDTSRRPGGLAAVLERFERGDTRVLIGTQMVSKGHHFPNVSLTAVLIADNYLSFPDFRAVERTYNLLTQVAGRAGRGERPGRVVIQTFHPDHYAIQAALTGNDAAFLDEEMRFRRAFHYPPFTRMVQLLVRDRKRDRAAAAIQELAEALARHPLGRGVRLTGPAPAPLERLRGEWRFQLLARSAAVRDFHRLLADVLPKTPPYDLTIDIDPQQLM
jgi:primosomal protein N' (replication factor Y)